MIEILEAQPLAGYRIRLAFTDGVRGEVDPRTLPEKVYSNIGIKPRISKTSR